MNIPDMRIEIRCLFCEAALMVDKKKQYSSGDMLKCVECGELNDYDSVLVVAREKGIELVRKTVEKQLQDQFKDLFKK
jgi:hypothetical protein